jgi:hypothetical protein
VVSLDYKYFTFTRSCMLCMCLCRRLGWAPEKCIQSARLFLQSSELRLPPLTRRRVCSHLFCFRGGYTLAAGEGVGGSQFRLGDRHYGTLKYLSIYALCFHRHGGGTQYTDNMRDPQKSPIFCALCSLPSHRADGGLP